MKKQFILLIALLLLCDVVYAQESENVPSGADYKSEAFYKNSDPATWIWDKVDFTNLVVYQNPKLYLSPAFSQNFHRVPAQWYGLVKFYQLDFNQLSYSSLSNEFNQHPAFLFHLKRVPGSKYGEVKWDNVDFTKIHFKDVDWNAQLPRSFHQTLAKKPDALNRYCREQSGKQCGITVDGGDVGSVVFTGRGLKVAGYSAELKHYPSGALFEVVDGKIIVHMPQNQMLSSGGLGSDTVRIVADTDFDIVTAGEKEPKKVKGVLEYRNGEWFIPEGKRATINKVEVIATKRTRIYGLGNTDEDNVFREMEKGFDVRLGDSGLIHSFIKENMVFFGRERILAVGGRCDGCPVTEETVTLNFIPGQNPYFKKMNLAGKSPYNQLYDDLLSITPVHGGAVWNGQDELLVSGKVRMQNGVHEILFDNGGVYAKAVIEDKKVAHDTVPMKVRFYKAEMRDDNSMMALNPYIDETGQPMKDKNGKQIENMIEIHENNYIEFGNVEYFALSVDPHHLLKDTKKGFKLVNNIARFTKPLIIVETPVKEKWEQEYFDATAQILADNVKGIPIIVRLENPKTKEERKEFLLSHSNLFEAIDEEAKRNKVTNSLEPRSEQVIIGHNTLRETGTGVIMPIRDEVKDVLCWDKLLGCALAYQRRNEIYQEIIDIGIRGGEIGGKMYQPFLKEGTVVEDDKVVGGDVYSYPDGNFKLNRPEGYKKIDQAMQDRLRQDDVQGLYDGGYRYTTYEFVLEIWPNKAPLHAALRAVILNNPELGKKSAKEILLSPEMQRIKFSLCKYAKEASVFASKATGQTVVYTNCK